MTKVLNASRCLRPLISITLTKTVLLAPNVLMVCHEELLTSQDVSSFFSDKSYFPDQEIVISGEVSW